MTHNIIKEMMQSKKGSWETLVVNKIEDGYIVGSIPKEDSYVVSYTCSNKSSFFPEGSSRTFQNIISQRDITEYIVKNREKKLEGLGI